MANIKFSELDVAATLTGTEIVPIVQSGSSVRTTINDIAALATGEVTTVKVSLTSAEILDLFNTPKQLVAAQGSNTIILPLRVLVYGHYGTATYATNTTLQFATGTLFSTNFSSALGFSADQLATYTLTTNAGTSTPTNSINAALMLTTTGGNPTTGDSTIDVYVTYTTITL